MGPLPYDGAPFAPNPHRFLVATYKGNFAASPIRYARQSIYAHSTLKAAARRLASLISGRGGKRGPDAAYIITPEGERLALRTAQARIKSNG